MIQLTFTQKVVPSGKLGGYYILSILIHTYCGFLTKLLHAKREKKEAHNSNHLLLMLTFITYLMINHQIYQRLMILNLHDQLIAPIKLL